jgi:hypothetical protein
MEGYVGFGPLAWKAHFAKWNSWHQHQHHPPAKGGSEGKSQTGPLFAAVLKGDPPHFFHSLVTHSSGAPVPTGDRTVQLPTDDGITRTLYA